MSNEKRRDYRGPKEEDLEKSLEPRFREYEEWRATQMTSEPSAEKKQERKGFGRQDVMFILLGFLAVTLYQSCRAAGQ